MELIVAKVIALTLLGVFSVVFGFLPIRLGSWVHTSDFEGGRNFWKRTITSVLLCFGGGVLLATSFVHMLPEVRENLESTSYDFDGIPVAEIFFCAGFFLIYLIEELVHCFCDASVDHHDEATLQVHRTFTVHTRACEAGVTDVQICESHDSANASPLVKRRRTVSTPAGRARSDYQTFSNDPQITVSASNGNGSHQSHVVNVAPEILNNSGVNVHTSSEEGHSHSSLNHRTGVRDFLTVLALSCHSIFEGLAVGLEDQTEAVWTLFAAIATHKYVISFCMGLELITARTSLKVFSAYMLVFALVSPLGVGIGIGISSAASDGGDAYSLTVAVLQALAGGTLIYVVVFEVLQREKSKSVPGMAQLSFVILGFCTLLCVEIFAGHDHAHDHEDATTLPPDPLTTVGPVA